MTKKRSPSLSRDDARGFVNQLMKQIAELYDANQRWKDELGERIEKSEQRVIQEFHVVTEDIVHNFQGAFHDKLDQHENRIDRLERHLQFR